MSGDDGVRDALRGFLAQFMPGRQLADGEDIFESGFVTSLVAVELVTFVEGQLGVALADDDLVLDNFRSIDAVAGLVARRRDGA
jgi:acyl carrier protein